MDVDGPLQQLVGGAGEPLPLALGGQTRVGRNACGNVLDPSAITCDAQALASDRAMW